MTELFFVDLKKSDAVNYEGKSFTEAFPLTLAEKIEKTKNESLKKDRIIVYTALIDILARKEEKLKIFENFCFSEKGKPYLKDSFVRFSLSHTDGMGVIAVSDTEIGVDIEKIIAEKTVSVEKICDKFYLQNLEFKTKKLKNVNYCLIFKGKSEINQVIPVNIEADEVNLPFLKWTNLEARLKLGENGFSEIRKTLEKKVDVKSYLLSITDADFAVSVAL